MVEFLRKTGIGIKARGLDNCLECATYTLMDNHAATLLRLLARRQIGSDGENL